MGLGRWVNRRHVSALLLLTAATFAIPAPTSSTIAVQKDGPQACGIAAPLPSVWSTSERWAWTQICQGRPADFDAALNTKKDSGRQTDDRFTDTRRKLSANFLRTVLVREPYRSAVPPEGVQITGASFNGEVILRDAVLSHVFGIFDSRFIGKLEMNRLRTPNTVAFTGSTFEKAVWLDSVNIGGNLNMTDSSFAEIVLKTAKIDGDSP